MNPSEIRKGEAKNTWKNENFVTWNVLSKITKELFSTATLNEYGTPTCFCVTNHGIFCFGMSSGVVFLYNSFQIFKAVLEKDGITTQVSCIDSLGDLLAVSHDNGEFVLWDIDNATSLINFNTGQRIVQINFITSSELLCNNDNGQIVLYKISNSSLGRLHISESFQLSLKEGIYSSFDASSKFQLIAVSTEKKVLLTDT